MGEHFRTILIVNPRAAGGSTGKRVARIAEQVRAHIGDFEMVFTERAGHATELARRAVLDGYEMVVGVGGDGTFNEVVNGFFEGRDAINPEAVFGLIPQGTGGDLRKTLGIENDLAAAARRLAGKDTRRVDVGHLDFIDHGGCASERMFVNITSFGVGGAVVDEVNRSRKLFGGKVTFMVGSAKALLRYRDQRVRLRFDDGPEECLQITNVAVCNGQYFGGGMWVAPKARMDDGLFDVTIWAGYSLKDFVLKQRMIYNGTHLDDARTRTLRARTVHAESDEVVLLDVDGEQPGRLPVTIEVLPSALRVKV
ncbi:MAG: diacylglycerol kinase family lipid kinase [Deltaproteobacteria bacterium]|nr:MAG: diacylglycerol kinase family lipid kinase [Deltaproteobacteria bacterium]